MLSADAFRARFDQTTASLRAWTGFVADVARIEVTENEAAWRIALQPHVAEACSIELLLRRDQHYDVTIGSETYEDLPIENLDVFQPLLEAIVSGRVVTRRQYSVLTGREQPISTIATLENGQSWSQQRAVDQARRIDPETLAANDRHYAPYRR